METKQFIATKAFVEYRGKILIVHESPGYQEGTAKGKFDVVGGRIKPGEHYQDGLKREVKEETGLDITIGEPFYVDEWNPVVNGERWQIIGIYFKCQAAIDVVRLSADHDAYRWINPATYREHNVMDDLHPVFETYLQTQPEPGYPV
ncbi:MAG: NUDIX domain-containing protein [Patescibacteria group bacterium]|nr:NUDIX domain-containing protein [Patescibacteria group bacterium]